MTKPGPHHELVKNDDLELRIIHAKPLSLVTPRRPFPKIAMRAKPTSADVLKTLRSTPGAKAVIDRFGNNPFLTEVAYWASDRSTGLADGEPVIWGCDFVSYYWDVEIANGYHYIYFAGYEYLGEIQKPNVLNGRVWCAMDTPVAGDYVFVPQVESYLDDLFEPDYVSTVTFGINGETFATRTLVPGQPPGIVFVLSLPAGLNRFEINQHTGAMFFRSLTVFQEPVFTPSPSLPIGPEI